MDPRLLSQTSSSEVQISDILNNTSITENTQDANTVGGRSFPQSPPCVEHAIFLYGSLADPSIIQGALSLKTVPILIPAAVEGYSVRTWSNGPNQIEVLVRQAHSPTTQGMSFVVKTEKEYQALCSHFGRNYRLEKWMIKEEGRRWPRSGWTVAWAGNEKDLKGGIVESALVDAVKYVPFERYMFFYGTLMIPHILREVLSLNHSPTLKPAQITGYAIKLWAQYPALVPAGSNMAVVMGGAFIIYDEWQLKRLEQYEGGNYRLERCNIKLLEENREVEGWTFAWDASDVDWELKDGVFDPSLFPDTTRRR